MTKSKTYQFTAFTEADMRAAGARSGENLSRGETFVMPGAASATLSVRDDDKRLSGDARRNDRADDHYGQHAGIEVDGHPAGNGGQIYAEAYYWLRDKYGAWYLLIEIEQERTGDNYFTFHSDYGAPPAGAKLTVKSRGDITCWEPRYEDLTAGGGRKNRDPVAKDDHIMASEDRRAYGELLDNDRDPDGDPLTVSSVSFGKVGAPSRIMTDGGDVAGVLIVRADGTYKFKPDHALNRLAAGETETVSFSYTVSDGRGGEATANVTLTIKGKNDAPIAIYDRIYIAEDDVLGPGPDAFQFNVLDNDRDIDGDALKVIWVSGAHPGEFVDLTTRNGVDIRVAITETGDVLFDPDGAFDGLDAGEYDSFKVAYRISDGAGGSSKTFAKVVIKGVDDAPEAVDDAIIVPEGGLIAPGDTASNFLNVLDNDGGPGAGALSVVAIEGVGPGQPVELLTAGGRTVSVQVLPTGVVLFDAEDAFADLEADEFDAFIFTYTASDAAGMLDDATTAIVIDGQGPEGATPLPDDFDLAALLETLLPMIPDDYVV